MKVCRAEVNMPKIRDYCREYPVIPANLNHLLLLYEPIDKTSYAMVCREVQQIEQLLTFRVTGGKKVLFPPHFSFVFSLPCWL